MQAALRQKYWILGARNLIRHFISKCLTCHRHKAEFGKQMMGNLPAARISPSSPFTKTGVDYAGPFIIKKTTGQTRGRPQINIKVYICVFVCLSTRAIHLEAATDLSTDAFFAALTRFVSRRGLCSDIYSDNGTNFQGAHHEMEKVMKFLQKIKKDEGFAHQLAQKGITWHFIPPGAPHFGGLWEAGVKSMKFHLKRTIGTNILDFEQLITLLHQVEACLNSRPFTQMSTDPADYNALTPGHFLIGRPLMSPPQKDLKEQKEHLLNKWEKIKQMTQQFWKRWKLEYLSLLQNRPKW